MSRLLPTVKNILAFLEHLNSLNLTEEENQQLVTCILTPNEIIALEQRLHIFFELKAGKTQRHIAKQLGTGISSITRGSRVLQDNVELLEKVFSKKFLS